MLFFSIRFFNSGLPGSEYLIKPRFSCVRLQTCDLLAFIGVRTRQLKKPNSMLSACQTTEKRTVLARHNVNFTSHQRKQINPISIRLKMKLFHADFCMSLYVKILSQTLEVNMMQAPLHMTSQNWVE